MKKRHHIYQIDREISPISQLSQRANRGRTRGLRPAMVAQAKSEPKAASLEFSSADDSDYQMKVEDELTNEQLKVFSFGCIESLSQLTSSDTNETIQSTLIQLTQEKLSSFVALVSEYKEARSEYKQYVGWSKKFVSTVEPLLNSDQAPTSETQALSAQTLQCVERSMGAQIRKNALSERVAFLTKAIPEFVKTTGNELCFPKPITAKIAEHVNKALKQIAQ